MAQKRIERDALDPDPDALPLRQSIRMLEDAIQRLDELDKLDPVAR